MKSKIIMTLITCLFIISTTSEAAKIDIYKNALQNKSFTLKYEIITPPVRQTNKEFNFHKNSILGKSYVDHNSVFKRKITSGIIVVDGENKYSEVRAGAYKTHITVDDVDSTQDVIDDEGYCSLLKDGDFFQFGYTIENGEKRYFGDYNMFGRRSKTVKANDNKYDKYVNPYYKIIGEYNYGSLELNQVLMPILPPDKVIALPDTPTYQFVKSGTLNNGLTFEDFAGSKNNTHYVVRYYFNGNKLVKIYAINYIKNEQGIQSYQKTMIDITEFSMVPDKNYLSLPKDLKIKK